MTDDQMKNIETKKWVISKLKCLLATVWLLSISACALLNSYYTLNIDTREDGQDAKLLDYRFMAGEKVIFGASRENVAKEIDFVQARFTYDMPAATAIFLKWQDNKSKTVYEKTIELGGSLRKEILENKTVAVMMYGEQVYVYLISNERREPNSPAVGPSSTKYLQTEQIYPKK